MLELFKIILTACITVIVGVFVFAIGQIILKFFIEPIQDQKKLIGEILSVIFHYYVVSLATAHFNDYIKNEAKDKMLFLAKDLLGKTQLIPYYNILEKYNIVIPLNNIDKVSDDLYKLADQFSGGYPDVEIVGEVVKNITSALRTINKNAT